MSTYISLGKIPATAEEKLGLLAKKVEMDEREEAAYLTDVQRSVIEYLLKEKDYSQDDIRPNKAFKVELPGASFEAVADVAISVKDKFIMIIKCVANSMASWERYAAAFGRVAAPYQIPYAVVTDGEHATVIDIIERKSVEGKLDTIPSKSEALQISEMKAFIQYPKERAEREKRIIHAFNTITCSTTIM